MIPIVLLCSGPLTAPAEATDADLQIYQVMQAQAGRDAAAHVRLALWCEAHGLEAERLKQLALAALFDPTHTTARGLLGLVADAEQSVFNLEVAHGRSFFVGGAGALVHDNSLVEPTPEPFDAPPTRTVAASGRVE
jgi:hypothetical protein